MNKLCFPSRASPTASILLIYSSSPISMSSVVSWSKPTIGHPPSPLLFLHLLGLALWKSFRPPFFAFPVISPHHCRFTPVEPGYGADLSEDDYLLLLAAYLTMDPAPRPRPVSSAAFACLGNTLQLNYSIERHIYSPSVFLCDIRSTTPIGMCFSILRIRWNI
jgi:hypothetical protein